MRNSKGRVQEVIAVAPGRYCIERHRLVILRVRRVIDLRVSNGGGARIGDGLTYMGTETGVGGD